MAFPTALRNLAAFRFSLNHLACAAVLCCTSAAHAQSLVELTEQAQTYDAAWQSARAQYEATLSQSAQAKAGLLPQIGIQAGSQYNETRVRGDFLSRLPLTSRASFRQNWLRFSLMQPRRTCWCAQPRPTSRY